MFNWARINLFTFLSLRFLRISFGSPVWVDSVVRSFTATTFLSKSREMLSVADVNLALPEI